MFSTIYIEKSLLDHPGVNRLLARYPGIPTVPIDRYGEVFNRKAQNFRLQKQKPALIVAKKHSHCVLPAPEGYGLGGLHNYYFSHLLNCIYDCRYCFLQGMYRSAHYVWFINYEDFAREIVEKLELHKNENVFFYSGYDCDSLALEPLTEFVDFFLPVLAGYPNALLELRTKSTQIRNLLARTPQDNCVIAFSFTPDSISNALEHKVPNNHKRIDAIKKLQSKGWKIGLRFDPLIYDDAYLESYQQLFHSIFSALDIDLLHSVSLGAFRLPETFYRNMQKLYPEEKLFATKIAHRAGMVSYQENIEKKLISECEAMLMEFIPKQIYHPCVLG